MWSLLVEQFPPGGEMSLSWLADSRWEHTVNNLIKVLCSAVSVTFQQIAYNRTLPAPFGPITPTRLRPFNVRSNRHVKGDSTLRETVHS